jgi:hypothetical protein
MAFTLSDIEKSKVGHLNRDIIPETGKNYSQKEAKNIPAAFALGRLKAGKMNKTEAAYAKYLEALKHAGEVLWYAFEPMNLKLADKCFYAVDFLVMVKTGQLECHEVKGYWTDDALVKIKTAAANFPFRFIAVRLVKGEWEVREF